MIVILAYRYGVNTCYIEKGDNLGKLEESRKQYKNILINLESGAYRLFPHGKSDKVFDMQTATPGEFLFEKKVAGAYLGGLAGVVIKHAAEEGLFSGSFKELLMDVRELTTIDVNVFLHQPFGDNILAGFCNQACEKDRSTLFYLLDSLVERAAKLVAINLIAVILKTGKGKM